MLGGAFHTFAAPVEDAIGEIASSFNSEDWISLEEMHTSDVIAFPPNQNRTEGRSEVVQLWKDYRASGIADLTFTSLGVNTTGGRADQYGTYSMKAPDQGTTVTVMGSFLAIWEQDTATSIWRVRRFAWNVEP